jgi:uncharacterized membrane protein
LGYFALRGAIVLAVAALIDVCIWRIAPFMTYDVLYVIGLSMPLVYLFRRIPSGWVRWGILAALVAGTPLLQHVLGYTDYPTEFYLVRSEQIAPPANETNVLHHILIDGWFPLFPWLAFSLLGAALADLRSRPQGAPAAGRRWALAGLGLLAAGIAAWWYYPGSLLTRGGYGELFYPPTVGFILTASGVIVLLFFLVDLRAGLAAYQPMRLLGEAALFMYIAHLALIQYFLSSMWPRQPQGTFLVLAAATTVAFMVVGGGIRRLKVVWKSRPMPLRLLLGG